MRVLALLPNAYDEGGGIAQYNRDWLAAIALSSQVSEIKLCCLGSSAHKRLSMPHEKIKQMRVFNSKWRFSLAAIADVWRFKPDVVFCGHFGLLKLLPWLPNKKTYKVWLQLHGIEAWPMAAKKMRAIAARLSLVTCVSRFTRMKALLWLHIPPENIKVLPNTIGKAFDVSTDKKKSIEFSGKKLLLTVGRLAAAEQYKGQDKIIAAMPEILQQYPECVYLIAGSGDDEPRLRNLAKQHGVEAQVKFLGQISSEDLPGLYAMADLYVMPSTGEGFGIAYLEAMACGTPALGLNVDGSVDPLADGELGICLDIQHALADAIVQSLRNTTDRQALSYAVKCRFGQESFNRQVGNLLTLPCLSMKQGRQ